VSYLGVLLLILGRFFDFLAFEFSETRRELKSEQLKCKISDAARGGAIDECGSGSKAYTSIDLITSLVAIISVLSS